MFEAHLLVSDFLLNETKMQDHPLTPLTDPDLRCAQRAQADWLVRHIDFRTVDKGAGAIAAALPQTPSMVIVDAVRDEDLSQISIATRGPKAPRRHRR
ncbi:four-carbon acid sugar kinase family protein [Sulfitobacter sp.]|uniref:four-carbon acid sugar kinase family protein n=1 Tax=Sulfitobacter sp. TaxID=1903071 RepID=UPI00300169DE